MRSGRACRRQAFRRAGGRKRAAGCPTSRCSRSAAARHRRRTSSSESDLLAINYTSGTTSRPKGVMITHRNAWMNSVGTLTHWPMTPADRYLWTLPMFHANGWTFTWTVTAAGAAHVCLRKVDAAEYLRARRPRTRHPFVRGADGAHRHREWAGGSAARDCAAACRCSPPALRRRPRRSSGSRRSSDGRSRMSTGSPRPRRSFRICEPLARARRLSGADRAIDQGSPGRRADHLRASCGSWTSTCRMCRTTGRRSAKSSPAAMW